MQYCKKNNTPTTNKRKGPTQKQISTLYFQYLNLFSICLSCIWGAVSQWADMGQEKRSVDRLSQNAHPPSLLSSPTTYYQAQTIWDHGLQKKLPRLTGSCMFGEIFIHMPLQPPSPLRSHHRSVTGWELPDPPSVVSNWLRLGSPEQVGSNLAPALGSQMKYRRPAWYRCLALNGRLTTNSTSMSQILQWNILVLHTAAAFPDLPATAASAQGKHFLYSVQCSTCLLINNALNTWNYMGM